MRHMTLPWWAAGLVLLQASALAVEVGQAWQGVPAELGEPAGKIEAGDKTLYRWPELEVTVARGRVVQVRKLDAASLAADQENRARQNAEQYARLREERSAQKKLAAEQAAREQAERAANDRAVAEAKARAEAERALAESRRLEAETAARLKAEEAAREAEAARLRAEAEAARLAESLQRERDARASAEAEAQRLAEANARKAAEAARLAEDEKRRNEAEARAAEAQRVMAEKVARQAAEVEARRLQQERAEAERAERRAAEAQARAAEQARLAAAAEQRRQEAEQKALEKAARTQPTRPAEPVAEPVPAVPRQQETTEERRPLFSVTRKPTDPVGKLEREITLLDLDLSRATFDKDSATVHRLTTELATKRAELETLKNLPAPAPATSTR